MSQPQWSIGEKRQMDLDSRNGHRRVTKKCFLCKQKFHSLTKHSLFCDICKATSERYRFAEWLTSA